MTVVWFGQAELFRKLSAATNEFLGLVWAMPSRGEVWFGTYHVISETTEVRLSILSLL